MTRQTLPWVTSAFTLVGMWLLAEKRWQGWVVGLVNQVFWIWTTVVFQTWGFIPLTVALVVIYRRGLYRWRRDADIENRTVTP